MAMKSITNNTTIQQFPSYHHLLHHHLRTTLQTPHFSVNNSPEKVTQRNSKRKPQISPLYPQFRFNNSTTTVCRRRARRQDSRRSLRDTRRTAAARRSSTFTSRPLPLTPHSALRSLLCFASYLRCQTHAASSEFYGRHRGSAALSLQVPVSSVAGA